MTIELPDGRSESNDVLEALRLRAVHARQLGYAVGDIATILGVREETVSRWCSRYARRSWASLRPCGPGRQFAN
jgi:transposase